MSDLLERLDRALGNQYRVTGELGRGGMAVVYSADDVKHGRPVAIKVMKPEIAHTLGTERFLREIEIVARLSHPNILSLHDSGTAGDLLYFVMPYVEGDTLRGRLDRSGPLALEETIRITAEVADALSFAHARGLIHRDIKPENILFQAGHAVVSDFGIAKAVTEAGGSTLTETGLAVGTLKYMSPEQAAGEAELDARSDIYSLACVLYEMLTGEPPFAGASPQALLVRKVTGPPPAISETRSDIPATIDGVVATALATEPGGRFDTPDQFIEALTRAATAGAIAEEAHRRQRAKRMRRAVGVPAVALVGALVWWVTTLLSGPAIERVAVLPLTNAMSDSAQDFFVEGVHLEMIKELARAGFGVINPTSVLQYRNSDKPVSEIARELGVDAVIEGSASLADDHMLLDLRMTDGVTDEIVWFDSFGAEVRDVLSVYGEVTLAIANAAGIAISGESEAALASAPQVDADVQQYLWQARFHRSQLSEESLSLALDYYQLALSRDPDNAVALAGISGTWGSRSQMGFVSQEEALEQGDPALDRAVAIDSTIAEVQERLASRRTWTLWDWAGAEASYRRTLDADPASRARSLYSQLLYYLGRDEEAAAQMDLALQQDPFNPQVQTFYAMELKDLKEYERADSVLQAVLAREQNYGMALTTLRSVYHLMGRYDEALDMWEARNAGDPEALEALDRGYQEGGYSGALRSMAEMLVARSDTTHVTPWQIGTSYARAGDTELALDYLELAFDEAGDPNIPYLSVDPIFDDLRGEPRFRRLIQRLGLPN